MTIAHKSTGNRLTPPPPAPLGFVRTIDTAKLRAKRLSCKTCNNKICVGRCRFEKVH